MQTVTVSEIFEKLEKRPVSEACASLLELARSRFSRGMPVLANFLYFANAEMRNVFEIPSRSPEDEKYARTLMEGDVLLPDWIALALSYARYSHPEISPWKMLSSYRSMGDGALPNLNGTDLLPYLIREFSKSFWPEASVYLYWAKEEVVSKAAAEISAFCGLRVGYRNGYAPFDFEAFDSFSQWPKLLLVGLGTPKQEFWTNDNAGSLGATLAVTVGWFFDFVGWWEKRAPAPVRSLRLEWLWRVLLNPFKNGKKALASLRFFPRFYKGFR